MTEMNLDLDISGAYDFYKRFILDYTQGKADIYARYGFTVQGSVGSKDWEVFAAILLRDRARPGDGADLQKHEVKSAIQNNSFEYQYHKHHGLNKLEADKEIDHVLIARSKDYADITVWWVSREAISPIFDSWRPDLEENYKNDTRQRFRRSVGYTFVMQSGVRLVEIEGGVLRFSEN